jgi:hypothetical protein
VKRLPRDRLRHLEDTRAGERRIHFLFVAGEDTAADFERQRKSLIAEGKARPADRFIAFRWKQG